MASLQGYPIAEEAYDLELFQLASIFVASAELSRISAGNQGISRLRSMFEQSEAARRLIAAAVFIRGKLDSRCVLRPNELERAEKADVGVLIADLSKPAEKLTLSFREACNKIIHATAVDLASHTPDDGDAVAMLSTTVTLLGSKRPKEWRAELNIVRFVNVASEL